MGDADVRKVALSLIADDRHLVPCLGKKVSVCLHHCLNATDYGPIGVVDERDPHPLGCGSPDAPAASIKYPALLIVVSAAAFFLNRSPVQESVPAAATTSAAAPLEKRAGDADRTRQIFSA
jgi:hypothetical protein